MPKRLTFDEWKKKVDDVIFKLYGLTSDGLPDFDYLQCYKNKVTPETTARRAIRWAQTF